MPPRNSANPTMDISLISLVEVPFAYGKPLRLNMTNISSGSIFPVERNGPYRCA